MARTEQHLYVTLDAIRRIRTRAGWNGPAHLLPYDPARYPSKQAHANARYKLKTLERRAIGHIAMQCNLLTDIKQDALDMSCGGLPHPAQDDAKPAPNPLAPLFRQDALDMPKCSCQKCATYP